MNVRCKVTTEARDINAKGSDSGDDVGPDVLSLQKLALDRIRMLKTRQGAQKNATTMQD